MPRSPVTLATGPVTESTRSEARAFGGVPRGGRAPEAGGSGGFVARRGTGGASLERVPAVYFFVALLVTGWGCAPDTHTALGAAENCSLGDGLIDCSKPLCALHLACDPDRVELICDNKVDDDGDGLTDCEDPDCARAQVCNPNKEVLCNDGLDNDGDGLVDCDDSDCYEDPVCSQEICTNGVDDNGNGLVDCEDPGCLLDPACRPENCTNGVDDNGNGLVDCEDPGCQEHLACQGGPVLEICNDGIDNDGDGKVDCADPDCITNPWCMELICDDGWDNDGNGLVDCEDPACNIDPACDVNPTCQSAAALFCDVGFVATTRGRPNTFTTYPCHEGSMLQGGEQFYRYTNGGNATEALLVTITSLNSTVTFALIALPGTASGCSTSDGCYHVQEVSSTAERREILVSVPAGVTVYFVVDSVQGEGGSFHLEMACPTSTLEICTNGVDDTQNGLIDCWDPDCLGHPGCTGWVSGGIGCDPANFACAPGERCERLLINQSTTEWGICTRTCSHPGLPGTDCFNASFPSGYCMGTSTLGDICIMRCGTSLGTIACPEGTQCTDPQNGNTVNVSSGICAPAAP